MKTRLKRLTKRFLKLFIKAQLMPPLTSQERKELTVLIKALHHQREYFNLIFGDWIEIRFSMTGQELFRTYLHMDLEIHSYLHRCLRRALPKYSVTMSALNPSRVIYIHVEPCR